ncbi:MAG TPA: tripartite tricarboxylate transporter substrate-binding protein [Bradyrhizobium sp.]|uniref:Bug family tripartite tricarboxylate transporter substrate binding protein n=1 Tax=Bradyrhizobium sp. TaxID=376 RepID=UPI002D7FFF69|nr:tripartite tricarboxylate transporter substrate-binding protein [Bradyrhizobium sp.]HET7887124.1 tripartite tricarboxylate transporter substrate-binding protein [Bradyrhizobium sp.]
MLRLVLIVTLAAFMAPVMAESWPSRPLTMVVPFATGGPMDAVARILQSPLSDALRQQVIIENIGGAGGMIGAARVAKSTPDGYQFVLGNVGTHAVSQTLYKTPFYNAATDFAPVILIAELSLVMVARKDFPANDLQQFIAYAKANQKTMQFASAGAGSATHLGCALINARIGIDVTHVPYRGGAPAMADLIAQRVDYLCIDTPTALPQIESGAIKPIAMLSRGRSPSLPGLASAHEQGLTDFEATNWSAFFLPRNTPASVVQRLHDATVAALNDALVQHRFKENGIDLVGDERRSPAYLARFVSDEIAKWAGPIKSSGLVLE